MGGGFWKRVFVFSLSPPSPDHRRCIIGSVLDWNRQLVDKSLVARRSVMQPAFWQERERFPFKGELRERESFNGGAKMMLFYFSIRPGVVVNNLYYTTCKQQHAASNSQQCPY